MMQPFLTFSVILFTMARGSGLRFFLKVVPWVVFGAQTRNRQTLNRSLLIVRTYVMDAADAWPLANFLL
jgi:hypothetical protein